MQLVTASEIKNNNWIEQSSGVMSDGDAENILNDIYHSRVSKDIDLWS